jgi:DNA excision repair protein ERCC-3
LRLAAAHRGPLKQALLAAGWPVDDQAGYQRGAPLDAQLHPGVQLRAYQHAAAAAFAARGAGVVVLPPGAGKTLVGIAALTLVGQRTLILTSTRTSVAQWHRELRSRTTLTADQIREYRAGTPPAPVTIATYQLLSYQAADGTQPHAQLIDRERWGLIVYDEVHSLPAPVFRTTAALQATRRLGLTATLVREDGRADDVFTLIGPRCYALPWRALEAEGTVAPAVCTELRVALGSADRLAYAAAGARERQRLAAENPAKLARLTALRAAHAGAPMLVIGQYLEQLAAAAAVLDAPLISGRTPQAVREHWYAAFRNGVVPLLVISKVGNVALDLPAAEVIVQLSGAFGSRQEEAQRLGRVLRPKIDGRPAYFYTLVSAATIEQDHALRRQMFLADQGYTYRIEA